VVGVSVICELLPAGAHCACTAECRTMREDAVGGGTGSGARGCMTRTRRSMIMDGCHTDEEMEGTVGDTEEGV